jgi:hypothetical protein
MGFLYLLRRDAGEPIFPVEERLVPQSDVPGEKSWPTQPFPTIPRPLMPTTLSGDDAWASPPGTRANVGNSSSAIATTASLPLEHGRNHPIPRRDRRHELGECGI